MQEKGGGVSESPTLYPGQQCSLTEPNWTTVRCELYLNAYSNRLANACSNRLLDVCAITLQVLSIMIICLYFVVHMLGSK